MSKLQNLWILFASFFKIGITTFGGGYAMLPILQKEIVEVKGWATEEEILDYYAIGQCTPGVVFVNVSTFIGYKQCGIPGGIIATLGVITPSLIIITIISSFLTIAMGIDAVFYAFNGIRVAVVILITHALFKLWKNSIKTGFAFVVFAVSLLLSLIFDVSPIIIVVLAAAVGIISQWRYIGNLKGESK